MYSNLKVMSEPRQLEIKQLGNFSKQFLVENKYLPKTIERALLPFKFQISSTHDSIQVEGDEIAVMLVSSFFEQISGALSELRTLDIPQIDATISGVVKHALKYDLSVRIEGLPHPLQPKSLSQVAFMQKLLSNRKKLIFGVGPTGTGKTHLAIAAALNQLAKGNVNRIVITRPHVVMEGEFVTSATRTEMELDDQFEYLEDVFGDLIGHHKFSTLIEQRKLDLMPLGHMRGRTFNDTFIVIDEAQNMTVRKMRMAVTRIGRNSRMVVTGNPTHVDLLGEEPSGLVHLLELLRESDNAAVHHFEKTQIIRTGIAAQLEELYAFQEDDKIAIAA
jgi:phosphate starvation-inducible PhoH-like protein